MNHVAPEQLRDLEPRFLRQPLDVVAHVGAGRGRLPLPAQGAGGVDDRPGPPLPDEIPVEVLEIEILVQLADLLVKGHLAEEAVDERFGGWVIKRHEGLLGQT